MRIIKPPTIIGAIAGMSVICVFDTGSSANLLNKDLWFSIKSKFPGAKLRPVDDILLSGFVRGLTCNIRGEQTISIDIDGHIFTSIFLVVDNLRSDMLLGMPFINQHNGIIDSTKQMIKITDDDCNVLSIHLTEPDKMLSTLCNQVIGDNDDESLKLNQIENTFADRIDLDDSAKRAIISLIYQYRDVFSDKPRPALVEPVRIDLTDNEPVQGRTYSVPYHLKDQLRTKIQKWLEWDIIEERASPYVNPIHCVMKKDGSIRPVVDLRLINNKVISGQVQVEPIVDILHRMSGSKIFSTFDIKEAYHCIKLTDDSIPITAFLFEGRQYCFKRLIMGLKSSCSIFQGIMNQLFDLSTKTYLSSYLDDILCYSLDLSSHIIHLRTIFEKLRERNFSLNFKKCSFLLSRIECLGHIVDGETISVNPKTNEAIREFPIPRTRRHLRKFLGLANWRRKYIHNFATKSEPLVALLRKEARFQFTDIEVRSFNDLKESLISAPALSQPVEGLPFVIYSDASSYSLAGFLGQRKDQEIRVIEYASRRIKPSEYSLSIFQLELLAVLFLCKHFSNFILGRDVTIYTDNQAVTHLRTIRNIDARTTRILLKLQRFSLRFVHVKGVENFVADTLSRCPPAIYSHNGTEIFINHVHILNQDVFTLEECKELQQKDSYCKKALDKYRNGNDRYLIRNNLLYCRTELIDDAWKLIIPQVISYRLALAIHNDGHFGIAKCLMFAKRLYYWRNMRKTFIKICRDCLLCAKTKSSTSKLEKTDIHVEAEKPHDKLSIDLVGRLPSSNRYIFILSVLDIYSRYLICYPLRTSTTNAIIKALDNHYFYHLPYPRVIVSDQGPQFKGRRWKDYCTSKNIRHIMTSPYSPSSNPVESHHKNLNFLIRLYCHGDHTKWSNFLSRILSLLNNSINLTTQYTPTELFLNYSAIDRYRRTMDWPEDIHAVDERHRYRLVLENIRRNRKVKKQQSIVDTLKEDDLVFIRSHRHSSAIDNVISKYLFRYYGPFLVKRVLRNCAVLTTLEGKEIGTQNFANLKLFKCSAERRDELMNR